MLAYGEQLILPALLLILGLVFIIYPGALWVLVNSRERKRRPLVISAAAGIALVCGVGAIATLKDSTWPPEWGDCIGLLIWAIPAGCGVIGLLKVAALQKHERDFSN